MKVDQISFMKGFIRIPSKKEVVNPDNIQTIGEADEEHKSYIMMDDCIEINNINAPVSAVAAACIEAQAISGIVDVKENKNKY